MFWMRSTDDTGERRNQKTSYIMPCDWEHAHDVMRRGPEQRITVNIFLHDSIWLQPMVSNLSRSCRAERRTVQCVNKPFYIIHCSFVLFVQSYSACSKVMIRIFKTMDGHETIIIIMFCARHILMTWCDYVPRNVQDVRIQCRADELMCMVWCAMSRTFDHSGY